MALLGVGDPAPSFCLSDSSGSEFDLDAASGRPVLVMFMCNHCPYVKHVAAAIGALTKRWERAGVTAVAIHSNDPQRYSSEDAYDLMAPFAHEHNWDFPYVIDASQAVAQVYTARCTPEFFLLDREHRIAYRGRLDGSRPSSDLPVTGDDLDAAIRSVADGRAAPTEQYPSVGCSIKWLPGNEPDQ